MKTKENSNLRRTLSSKLEEIKNLYLNDNVKVIDIANLYGCSEATLRRFLSENNIRKNKKIFKDEEYLPRILELKDLGKTPTEICSLLGMHNSTYNRILKTQKEDLNIPDDFIDFDSEFFWYFLGFFCADGHFDPDRDRITLWQKDSEYLEMLKTYLKCNNKLHKDSKGVYYFYIKNTTFSKYLKSQNIGSNKSLIVPFIQAPNKYLQIAFVRGYFDGDGCISFTYTSDKFTNRTVTITSGSLSFITSLKCFLEKNNFHPSVQETKSKNICYNLTIQISQEIIDFMDMLYKDSFIYMRRKYIIYLKFLEIVKINDKYK